MNKDAHTLYLYGEPCATVYGNTPRETCDAVDNYLCAEFNGFRNGVCEYAGAGEWDVYVGGVHLSYRVDWAHVA